jgi:hypothetical protein
MGCLGYAKIVCVIWNSNLGRHSVFLFIESGNAIPSVYLQINTLRQIFACSGHTVYNLRNHEWEVTGAINVWGNLPVNQEYLPLEQK